MDEKQTEVAGHRKSKMGEGSSDSVSSEVRDTDLLILLRLTPNA